MTDPIVTPTEIVEKPTETVVEETKEELPPKVRELLDKLRSENKELAKAAKKVTELETEKAERERAAMSELDKAKADLVAMQKKVHDGEIKEMRRSVAEKVGLPSVFASRIQGETPEEMETDAMEILKALPTPKPTPPSVNATNPSGAVQVKETDEARRARLRSGVNQNWVP